MYVEHRETIASLRSIDKFSNKWQGIVVLDCPLVELLIIVDWPESPALLLDEKEGSSVGAFGRMDISFS